MSFIGNKLARKYI